MRLSSWIKGLLLPNDFDDHLDREIDHEIARRRGSNPSAPGSKPAAPAGPPAKPQPTGGRLIYGDREPGPVPPRLPDDPDGLPVLTAQHLDGAAVAPVPAEMPSDELMERWKSIASHEWLDGGPPVSHRVALLAIAWSRQQQAQSFRLPPPGADPVATDEDLIVVATGPVWTHHASRALYEKGRADERTAILRALGVEP